MAIIIDADQLFKESYKGYVQRVICMQLAASMPKEQFLVPYQAVKMKLPQNITCVEFHPQKGLFTQSKTDKWLRLQNATHYISFTRALRKTNGVKQFLIILSDEKPEERRFQSADYIGFISVQKKEWFVNNFSAYAHRAFLLENIVETCKYNIENQNVKDKYSGGQEYFISADFDLDKEKFITLLKGFSVFKKMQQSSWKLKVVLRSDECVNKETAQQLLSNYKYRDDVVLSDGVQINEKIAAAYALVGLSKNESAFVTLLEASNNHTPIITVASSAIKNIYGEAVVYLPANDSQAIGDMLMLMYKGEKFRQGLIKKMKELSQLFTSEMATEPLKQLLNKK